MNHILHQKVVTLAKTYLSAEKEMVSVLIEIDKLKLFRTWGYSSLFQYVASLGLSEAQCYALITVARKCIEVPELKMAVVSGSVSISKARRIVPVIEKNNSQTWIEKAQELTCQQLERAVAQEEPELKIPEKIRPTGKNRSKLELGISIEIEKKLKRLQDLLSQKQKGSASLEETLDFALEEALEKHDPVRKAERQLARAERMATPAKSESKTKAHAIHVVRARDQGKCQAHTPEGKICSATRFVEIHHIIPRSLGGADEAENLITLCSCHHKGTHEQVNAMEVAVGWTSP